MELKEYHKKTIDTLAKHEEMMSALYMAYANLFPPLKDFWQGIAKDEIGHANWIKTLSSKIKADLANFAENRFPLEAIEDSIKFLDEKRKETESGNIKHVEALEMAMSFERGMLEKNFFEVFEQDSIEVQIILDAIRYGTHIHFEEIKKAYDKEKSL